MPRKIAVGFLTVAQAADRIGVTTAWIYQLIQAKVLKPYKQGIIVIKETQLQTLEIPQEMLENEK